MIMGTINKNLIREEIFKNKEVQKSIQTIVQKEINKQKQIFLAEFNAHPVTQELESGENASNISGTLGGYGNLFSFIGFTQGANPISPIRALIEKIRLVGSVRVKNNNYQFTVNLPSKEDFGSVSKLPWESGRSWLLDIERGISGLGAYLYGKFTNSRSSVAIQTKYNYSNTKFKNVKYFSQMYNKFIKQITGGK